MRAFISIECPDELKEGIVSKQKELTSFGDLKLVQKENLHITLKFLGEVSEERIEEIKKSLVSVNYPSFEVSLKGLGAFPSPASARIVWVGAEKGCKEVEELSKLVDSLMNGLGFEKEKRFSCHLTVARARSIDDKKGLIEFLSKEKETGFGSFKVESIQLMKSELRRAGPIYTPIERFSLEPTQ